MILRNEYIVTLKKMSIAGWLRNGYMSNLLHRERRSKCQICQRITWKVLICLWRGIMHNQLMSKQSKKLPLRQQRVMITSRKNLRIWRNHSSTRQMSTNLVFWIGNSIKSIGRNKWTIPRSNTEDIVISQRMTWPCFSSTPNSKASRAWHWKTSRGEMRSIYYYLPN